MRIYDRYEEIVNEIWCKKEKQTRKTKCQSQEEATPVFADEYNGKTVDKSDALAVIDIVNACSLDKMKSQDAFDDVYQERSNYISFELKNGKFFELKILY